MFRSTTPCVQPSVATPGPACDFLTMPLDPPQLSERDLPPCGCGTPGEAGASTCYCGVEDLLRIIRRRYSLAVMNAIHTHEWPRYHDIAGSVSGISSSTLAETLRALEAAQLLVRSPGREHSPFPTYGLTPSGEKLLSRLRQLLEEI